ncbi:MAG: relaxase/mobilization nuclease domain-containing protein [Hyphomicrobiaceae bacterium]|nr:relaxase/mobilization nuclease domain-containing protein [Hyphomicrobiaceae bacterium]
MILVGSQRGGATQLAAHLQNILDNDHVSVEQIRGFMADDLKGAFNETQAVSKGTRCKQFLFSLSLNPPKDANASIDQFMDAIERAEDRLGLVGQPRAVVFHEKEGRRHAHAVWSRIDVATMKAINLPHFKNKLKGLSKELFLEHGWELPRGHRENGWKNPLNFSLEEWQQAKRLDLDPREVKQVLRDAWDRSDNQKSFAAALEEHGYYLARGDRRGFVAVDYRGEVYSLSRWTGVKTKELRTKLGEPDKLDSVDQTKARINSRLSDRLRDHLKTLRGQQREKFQPLINARKELVADQRMERAKLKRGQTRRWKQETRTRSERLNKGLRGVWELLTGKARAIRRKNDLEAYQAYRRDRSQREDLFQAQMKDRKSLQARFDALREHQMQERKILARKMAEVLRLTRPDHRQHELNRNQSRQHGRGFDMEM